VIAPIFHRGELVGFAAATAHLIDVGAAAPGLNVDLIDVFAEGTLYDSVKLYERRARRNDAVWSILRDSVRTPDSNAADIEAMIAAVRTGADRFLKLVDRHDPRHGDGRGELLDGLLGAGACALKSPESRMATTTPRAGWTTTDATGASRSRSTLP